MFSGTMGPEPVVGSVIPNQGALYLLRAENDLETVVWPVSISNGLAWNRNNTLMYYIDTATGQVDVFDFDLGTATIGEYSNADKQTVGFHQLLTITGCSINLFIQFPNIWLPAHFRRNDFASWREQFYWSTLKDLVPGFPLLPVPTIGRV
jgi:hypothetical protein